MFCKVWVFLGVSHSSPPTPLIYICVPLQVLNIPSWTIKANRFHFLCLGTDKVPLRVVLGWKLRPNDLRITQDCIRIAACRDAEQRQSSQGRRHVLLLIQFWCRWPKHGYAKSTRNVVSHQMTAKEFSNIPWYNECLYCRAYILPHSQDS